jgi:hypothetical protein
MASPSCTNLADILKVIEATGALFQKLADRWSDSELECKAFQSDLTTIKSNVQTWQALVGAGHTQPQADKLERLERGMAALFEELQKEEQRQQSSWRFSKWPWLCLGQRGAALAVPNARWLAEQISVVQRSMQCDYEDLPEEVSNSQHLSLNMQIGVGTPRQNACSLRSMGMHAHVQVSAAVLMITSRVN